MENACSQFLRIILVIYNFFIVLIGLFILGFAVYAYLEPVAQELIEASDMRTYTNIAIYVLMAIGALTLIVALFGCCGAYHESAGLLATYFTFLFIIFAIQIIGGALGFIYRDQLLVETEQKMKAGVNDYLQPVTVSHSRLRFMDSVQKVLKCCGVHQSDEYGKDIPLSCCNAMQSSCHPMPILKKDAYPEGCYAKYISMSREFLFIFFIVMMAISAFEILGLLFSLIMCCTVRKSNSDYYDVDYAATN